MNNSDFPLDRYIDMLVRFFDAAKYQDNNLTRSQRAKVLQYVYSETAKHFAQPLHQDTLKVNPRKLESGIRSVVVMAVSCWPKASPEVVAALSIHWTYAIILDDVTNDLQPEMAMFFEDLVLGRQQKHPWLQLVIETLPNFLKHYGSFCAFNIVRSTFDFFQGCWIEHYNFQGYPGSHDYPPFLRRLNGLGQAVGAALFPAAQFDEQALFVEMTTAISVIENYMTYANDLLSSYKELEEPLDQTTLVKNYCRVGGISLDEAHEKLTGDLIHCCEQLALFKGKDPNVEAVVQGFVQGYITWHLCDERYRLNEVYERSGDGPVGARFRRYYEDAIRVAYIDPAEWAVVSNRAMTEQV